MFACRQHPLVMRRAHRSLCCDRLREYSKGHEDVWFARCNDVAQWWLKHYNVKQDFRTDKESGQPVDSSGRQRAAALVG
jgi:hypothetical protein